MRFGALVCAGFAAVASAIPAEQVVKNIDSVTSLSMDLQTPAKGLSVIDGALLPAGQGNFPPVIQGFTQIVNVATQALNSMNPETYNSADSDLIFESFRKFVMVHQELLNILIGKAGLFNTVPFIGQPVAAVLRAVEGVVDSLAFSLIDMAESRAKDIQQSGDSLGSSLDTTIKSYEGLDV